MNITIFNKILSGFIRHSSKSTAYASPKQPFHLQQLVIDSNTYYLFVNRANKLVTITIDNKQYQSNQALLLLNKPVTNVKFINKKFKLKQDGDNFVEDIQEQIKEYSRKDFEVPYLTPSFLKYLNELDFKILEKDSEYLFNIPLTINQKLIDKIEVNSNGMYIYFINNVLPSFCLQHCSYDEQNKRILTNNYRYVLASTLSFSSKFCHLATKQIEEITLLESFNLSNKQQFRVKQYCSELDVSLTEENIKMVCKLKGWL